jgi:signal transduction histidine kinase
VLRWLRWSAEPSGRGGRLLLWPAGAVAGVAAEWRLYGWADPGGWVPDLLTGWTLIGCGLAGWARRPHSRSGAPLAAAGLAWFVPDFAAASAGLLGWVGAHALYLHRGPLVQLVLTYPRGRVSGRVEGAAVAVGYAAAVVTPMWGSRAGTVALAACLVTVAARGYVRAAGRERRMRRSALQATALFAAGTAAVASVRFAVPGPATDAATLLAYEVMLCALAVGLLIGLLRWPWERAEVADLVVELGEARSGTLRDQLARALGDPSLQVGYWLPESAAFVDAAGSPLAVPAPGSGRSATVVERDGQPLAVLVHDPAVLGDPGLVEAVSSAAGLAAANARLQGEVRSRLAEIAASRRRILAAGDEERGRLERRLGHGAQRRLGELAYALRLARQSAAGQGTTEGIARAEVQLARTQEDLARLARGLHPRQLSEQGLAAALAALAGDFPLHVDLTAPVTRTTPSVAACAYFVCCEALANVAKHASASAVQILVTARAGTVIVEVADDGAGGADPHGGGIRGLADRVETLGGTLTVASAPGRGTRLTAVIPDGAEPP